MPGGIAKDPVLTSYSLLSIHFCRVSSVLIPTSINTSMCQPEFLAASTNSSRRALAYSSFQKEPSLWKKESEKFKPST
jgi:hypothetical protein